MSKLSALLIGALELLMAIGLLVIGAIVVVQVILSSGFNSSITGANEVITILFVYLTAIGAAVAVGKHEHIAITVAVERMSKRRQRITEVGGLVAVAILNAIVVAYSVHWIHVTGYYLMPTTQLPRIIAQLSVPIGSTLAVIFCIARIWSPTDKDRTGSGETAA
jgi:TRAP-type C4-dicarboxylate transport system permease small subunit